MLFRKVAGFLERVGILLGLVAFGAFAQKEGWLSVETGWGAFLMPLGLFLMFFGSVYKQQPSGAQKATMDPDQFYSKDP